MLNTSDFAREAALLVRPLPWSMARGDEPIRFGGRPRLPENLNWPAHELRHQFFAEIDLARLPQDAELPDMPTKGTIFIFLPLANDGLYGVQAANVIFTPDDVTSLPERDPPEDLPDIRESDACHVHEDGMTDGGTLLVQQVGEVLPFFSERAVNPLAVNMSEGDGFDGAPWRDAHKAHNAAVEKAFRSARAMPRDPSLGAVPDGFADFKGKVPKEFRDFNWAEAITWIGNSFGTGQRNSTPDAMDCC